MKRITRAIRVLVPFMLIFYVSNLLFGDIFKQIEGNVLLFLIVSLPYIQFVVACFQLVRMIVGTQYQSYKTFKIVRKSSARLKYILRWINLERFFFLIPINQKERIVSGLFWQVPTQVWIYKDLYGRLRTLTLGNVLIRLIIILASMIVLIVIKIYYLFGITINLK